MGFFSFLFGENESTTDSNDSRNNSGFVDIEYRAGDGQVFQMSAMLIGEFNKTLRNNAHKSGGFVEVIDCGQNDVILRIYKTKSNSVVMVSESHYEKKIETATPYAPNEGVIDDDPYTYETTYEVRSMSSHPLVANDMESAIRMMQSVDGISDNLGRERGIKEAIVSFIQGLLMDSIPDFRNFVIEEQNRQDEKQQEMMDAYNAQQEEEQRIHAEEQRKKSIPIRID